MGRYMCPEKSRILPTEAKKGKQKEDTTTILTSTQSSQRIRRQAPFFV